MPIKQKISTYNVIIKEQSYDCNMIDDYIYTFLVFTNKNYALNYAYRQACALNDDSCKFSDDIQELLEYNEDGEYSKRVIISLNSPI